MHVPFSFLNFFPSQRLLAQNCLETTRVYKLILSLSSKRTFESFMASQSIEPIHFVDLKDSINTKSPILGALFLFFLLFFTFLFVYFMYTCTNNHRGGGGEANAPPSGLDPSVINGLPVVSYGSSCLLMNGDKPSSPEAAECAICLSTFQGGVRVTVLPLCSHGFHSNCVDRWLSTRSSCPLCRSCIV